jgi:hypothetical protein
LEATSHRAAGYADNDDDLSEDSEVLTEEIDIVVAHLKRIVRRASLEFALNVGNVIIHHFYGGDTDAWRSRGVKSASFRRLAGHPELPLSPGALYRCVALYELCERLNAPSRWEHLGASHLRLVLGLPPTLQEKILASANAKRLTVKAMHQEVAAQKGAKASRGGRRPHPPLVRSLITVRRSLNDYRHVLTQLGPLSHQDRETTLRLIDEARLSLESLRAELDSTVASRGRDA